MSASVQELRDDLRATATKKRGQAFENATNPANLADVVSQLRAAVQALTELIASQAKAGPVEFEVTERDSGGKVKLFKVKK